MKLLTVYGYCSTINQITSLINLLLEILQSIPIYFPSLEGLIQKVYVSRIHLN